MTEFLARIVVRIALSLLPVAISGRTHFRGNTNANAETNAQKAASRSADTTTQSTEPKPAQSHRLQAIRIDLVYSIAIGVPRGMQ